MSQHSAPTPPVIASGRSKRHRQFSSRCGRAFAPRAPNETLIGYGLLAMWALSRAGPLKTYHPAAHPQARVGLIISQFEALPEQAKVDALANSNARRAKMPAGARDKARSRQLAKHEEEKEQLKALSDAGGMGTDLSLGHHLACLLARELACSSRSLQSSIIILKQSQRFQILTGRSGSKSVTCLTGRRCRSCSRIRIQHLWPERTARQGRSLLAQGSCVYTPANIHDVTCTARRRSATGKEEINRIESAPSIVSCLHCHIC